MRHPKLRKPKQLCVHGILGKKSCIQCRRDWDKKRYARDGEKRKLLARQQYYKNPQAAKARSRAYKAEHPEYANEDNARRRASMRAARCRCCSAKDIRIVYAAAALVGYEVDHIVALANGGKHCCKNLQLLTLAAHKEKTKQDRRAHWKP